MHDGSSSLFVFRGLRLHDQCKGLIGRELRGRHIRHTLPELSPFSNDLSITCKKKSPLLELNPNHALKWISVGPVP
jgi:hypothetical protein